MSGQGGGGGDSYTITAATSEVLKQEDGQGTLLVAMQPGVEIPAIGVEEVVVITEGDTDGFIGQVELETTIDGSTEPDIPIPPTEIVYEDVKPFARGRRVENYDTDDSGSYARRSMVYERQGVKASKGRPPESSAESESEDDSESPVIKFGATHDDMKKTPKKREFAYRLQWRGKDMLEAMEAVEVKKMTIRGAAKKYLVPYSTLKDRIHGRVRHGTKPGVKTALSPEEEEELVRYVKDMEAAGFQIRNSDVRERAAELLRLNYGHSSPYGEGSSPGHNWLSGFLKRHQGIEFKRQANRTVVPSCGRQRQFVKKFFEITAQVYKKNRLQTKPERIYVVSEMKMAVFQKASIVYAASAAGHVIPPFIIFKGQQKLKLTSAREAYPQAFFTTSSNGVVTEEIFLWWFRDHFLKAIPHSGSRPLVLFISQSCINISLQMYQLAKDERVIFISIPHGVAHLLQPLDDELGNYIEGCLSKKVKKWENLNSGSIFNQKVLAQLLQKVWRKVLTNEEIASKFSKVGIYPLNAAAISTDKILAMSHALRETWQQMATPTPANDEDDALQGLSLLSALSSHEYATFGRSNSQSGSQDNLDQSYDHEEEATTSKRILDFDTPSGPPAKRPRFDEDSQDMIERDMEPIVQQVVDRVVSERSKSQVLVKQENQADKSGSSSKIKEHPIDVQSEIALARENLDQINRAVDSILSSEPGAPSTSHVSPRQSSRIIKRPPRYDNIKTEDVNIVKVKAPAAKNTNKKSHTTAPRKPANILSRSGPKVSSQVNRTKDKKPPTRKIIVMLNKDGQLVSSQPQIQPQIQQHTMSQVMSQAPETPLLLDAESVEEEVIEEPVQNIVNIKMEEHNGSEIGQIVEEEVIHTDNHAEVTEIYTTTDNTFVTTGPEMTGGYSLTGAVEEQPPQNILQDEDLDLDSVDTILINGQLFRVIRPQTQNPVNIKHEPEAENVQLTEYEDGSVVIGGATDIGRASVIHQEVVQDYEVSSFEQVTVVDGAVHPDTVIEEHIV